MIPILTPAKFYILDTQGNEVFSHAGIGSDMNWLPPVNLSDSWPCIFSCGDKKYIISDSKVEELRQIRSRGEYIFNFQTGFSCGFAVASTKSGRFGAVGKKGEWLIPPKYDSIEPFVNGLCLAESADRGSSLFTIDVGGNIVDARDDVSLEVESTVNCCRDPLKYIAMIKNGKGYKPALILGGRRKFIHGSQYIVSAFSSAAVVQVGEEHSRVRCIVNTHGDLVGSKYAWVEYLGGDLFSAKRSMEGGYCDVIDARRGVLFRCLERYHPSWCAGFFTVFKNEGAMILNANGKVVCSTNRGRIFPHFGGFAWYDSLGEVGSASAAVLDYRFRCVWKVGSASPELYN